MNQNVQMYKLGLEKAEEPEIKLPTIIGSWRKQKNSRKNILFFFTEYAKAFAQETWVWSLVREDPLEKGMATHSSVLAWRIPWTDEPGEL